jgi:hypothetical protein
MENEMEQLKQRVKELQKKVDDLYSTAGFPEEVMRAMVKKGFFRVKDTLNTTFPTVDGYDITYYYQFGDIGNREVVFSNLDINNFTRINSINTSTNVLTANGHGLGNGNPVTFRTTGTPPSPLLSGGTYYIADATANTFKLSSSSTGTPIVNITNQGNGTHFLQKVILTF